MEIVAKFLILVAIFNICICPIFAATNKLACYYGNWSIDKPNFKIENIDPFVCTHIIYSFLGINDQGSIIIMNEDTDITRGSIAKVMKLKERNPALKVMFTVGGWDDGSVKYSNMASSPQSRARFIQSGIDLMNKYGFDGLDIDWEQPGERGGTDADKANFAILVREARQKFNSLSGKRFLLSAAVVAIEYAIEKSYDVTALTQNLDWISLMTYDLHFAAIDGRTGENAPLYASSVDVTAEEKMRNVDACVRAWLAHGARPDRLVLGVGTYGHSYTLEDNANHGIGAPTSGPGIEGPISGENGTLDYNEICVMLQDGSWATVWSNQQKVPYSYKGSQWVGYDNVRSIKLKAAYAKTKNLGGVMAWSISNDDYEGRCGPTYGLLKAVKEELRI